MLLYIFFFLTVVLLGRIDAVWQKKDRRFGAVFSFESEIVI